MHLEISTISCAQVDLRFITSVFIIGFWWSLWMDVKALMDNITFPGAFITWPCSPVCLSDNSKLCGSTNPFLLWTLAIVLCEILHFSKPSCVGGIFLAFILSVLSFPLLASYSICLSQDKRKLNCSCLSYRT